MTSVCNCTIHRWTIVVDVVCEKKKKKKITSLLSMRLSIGDPARKGKTSEGGRSRAIIIDVELVTRVHVSRSLALSSSSSSSSSRPNSRTEERSVSHARDVPERQGRVLFALVNRSSSHEVTLGCNRLRSRLPEQVGPMTRYPARQRTRIFLFLPRRRTFLARHLVRTLKNLRIFSRESFKSSSPRS